jgi:hypothetical protein
VKILCFLGLPDQGKMRTTVAAQSTLRLEENDVSGRLMNDIMDGRFYGAVRDNERSPNRS